MNPILKKISILASLASVPAFLVGDVIFTGVTINKLNSYTSAKNEIVAEYKLTDNFNNARTKKESEYIALYDENMITENEFEKYLKDLDSQSFAESQLLENGSDGEKIRFKNADEQLTSFSQKSSLAAAGLVAGNALAAFALAMGIKKVNDDEKKKKADSEDDKQI